jgi:hypothetical protein
MIDVNNFEIWLRKVCFQKPTKEAYDLAKDAWNEAGTSLRAENERLREFNSKGCQDDTQQCQYLQKIERLRAENRELREALDALHQHTKNNYQICGLNEKAKAALKGEVK